MPSLPIVCDARSEPALDVVAVPGLPDLFPEYRVKDHSAWLQDVLSRQIPGARIMSYRYDFGQSRSNLSWKCLADLFMGLLLTLLHRRESVDEVNRPIIFIAHGLGALILKKGLLEASREPNFRKVFDSVAGLVFLGALHHEDIPYFEDAWLRCAVVELRALSKEKSIVETLRKSGDWDIVTQILQDFRALKLSVPIRSFFEYNATVYQSGKWKAQKSAHLCTKDLATLDWDSEDVLGIEMDHGRLSTLPSRSESVYEIVAETIAMMVPNPHSPTSMPAATSPGSHLTRTVQHESVDVESVFSVLSIHGDQQTQASTSLINSLPQPTLSQARLPCFVTTPHRQNPEFIGRKALLAQMHAALSQNDHCLAQKTFAICGLGGMGKTQATIQYVYSHKSDFRVVLWAHADSLAKLTESFSMFTVELGLRSVMSSDHSSNKEILHNWLSHTRESWLLVFDNADSLDKEVLLKEFWPATDRGSILITSRDRSLVKQFGGIELLELDEESAVGLLISLTGIHLAERPDSILDTVSRQNSDPVMEDVTRDSHHRQAYVEAARIEEEIAAKNIVKRIGYLPLGIKHAANLIVQDNCSLSSFLEAYDNRELIKDSEEVTLARTESQIYAYSLRTVWNMSFDRLSIDSQNMMNVMAFLDPDRVQMQLFSGWCSAPSDPRLQFTSTPNKLHKSKTALMRSSLVTQNEALREMAMHRLVQASCHLRMSKQQRQENFGIAVSLVKKAWPVPPRNAVHNPSLWPEQQSLLPHVQTLNQYYVNSCMQDEPLVPAAEANWEFAKLLYEAGWFCYERGLLDLVSDILRPAEHYCLKRLEDGHQGGDLVLADIYGGLGAFCTETNQFQGAYDNFLNQWNYLQKAFESGEVKRPSIYEVFGLGRLANGLLGLHKYTEAEVYYRKCLKVWEEVPGDQKIFTTHLATCLWLQGRLTEAEETVTTIIKDRNDTTNFRTGQALFALGNIEIAQSEALFKDSRETEAAIKYQNAYDTHSQALRLYNATLGPRHHKTADAYYKMGWHMHRKRDYMSAKTMLNQAMSIYQDHSALFKNEIARTTYKLGCLYEDMGDPAKGRMEIERAERMRQECTPPEKWEPAVSEVAYDDIVMYWTR